MRIALAESACDFRPWSPGDGRVFDGPFAFDCETTPLDEARPWLVPPYVLGAACDGRRGVFPTRDRAVDFLRAHEGVPMALHNAPFDLAVLHELEPPRDVYRAVDADLVWDTQLLHRLHCLATEGHTAARKGQSTLETCVRRHLGIVLPKDVVDSAGRPVRTSYGRWLNVDPSEIEPVYLEYLAKDALATWLLHAELRRRIDDVLRESHRA